MPNFPTSIIRAPLRYPRPLRVIRALSSAVGSRIVVDNGEAALRLAIADGGIARLADLIAADAVREGKLRPVLKEATFAEPVPLSAVYPQGRYRMPKVRVFLDFLVEQYGQCPWCQA